MDVVLAPNMNWWSAESEATVFILRADVCPLTIGHVWMCIQHITEDNYKVGITVYVGIKNTIVI